MVTSNDLDLRLEALRRYGNDAVSNQTTKAGVLWWHDSRRANGTGARVGYVRAGRSLIAVGSPLIDRAAQPEAVRRFIAFARSRGYRPVFFGVEDVQPFAGLPRIAIGLQSVLRVSEWDPTLRRTAKLREQLRRARAKGVTVRLIEPREFQEQAGLRLEVDRLRAEWLASRGMEPLGFVVAIEPFRAAVDHLYFLAERNGKAVQFLSAVPIGGNGWMMEDMLRGFHAPNGTTELLIDALMRKLRTDMDWVTPGLTPLAGDLPWWLRFIRYVAVPMYDFSGLRRFRERLHPSQWRTVWLVWDRGSAARVILDVLRAFAGGRVLRFAWRSLARHPNGAPWAVAIPLVFWTALLAILALAGDARILGFSTKGLYAWTVFDASLACLLFRIARRPRPLGLAVLCLAAAFDALISVTHLLTAGLGRGVPANALRALAATGPVLAVSWLFFAWRMSRHALRR